MMTMVLIVIRKQYLELLWYILSQNNKFPKRCLTCALCLRSYSCISCCLPLRQNLLEKSAERETRQEYALAMIQCKVLKQLENLEQQKYDDEDITEDIKFLLERLGESVQDLRYPLIMDPAHGHNCGGSSSVTTTLVTVSRFHGDRHQGRTFLRHWILLPHARLWWSCIHPKSVEITQTRIICVFLASVSDAPSSLLVGLLETRHVNRALPPI